MNTVTEHYHPLYYFVLTYYN
uniref:Uncharacterized protein n=1 Tax=Anguilla anguilla TaxID=7936 RepID=A0A0E9TWG9_ANGAN